MYSDVCKLCTIRDPPHAHHFTNASRPKATSRHPISIPQFFRPAGRRACATTLAPASGSGPAAAAGAGASTLSNRPDHLACTYRARLHGGTCMPAPRMESAAAAHIVAASLFIASGVATSSGGRDERMPRYSALGLAISKLASTFTSTM